MRAPRRHAQFHVDPFAPVLLEGDYRSYRLKNNRHTINSCRHGRPCFRRDRFDEYGDHRDASLQGYRVAHAARHRLQPIRVGCLHLRCACHTRGLGQRC